jgi:hypothetical protein
MATARSRGGPCPPRGGPGRGGNRTRREGRRSAPRWGPRSPGGRAGTAPAPPALNVPRTPVYFPPAAATVSGFGEMVVSVVSSSVAT